MRIAHNKTSEEKRNQILKMYSEMCYPKEIADSVGVSRSVVDRVLREHCIPRHFKTSKAREITKRKCTMCKKVKALSDFPKSQKHVKYLSHSSRCKICQNAISSAWKSANIEKCRARGREIARLQRINNAQFRIAQNLRRKLRFQIEDIQKGKTPNTEPLVSCNGVAFKNHFESLFSNGMNWANHGKLGWHVDHIMPCSSFDLTNPDEVKRCFHFSNLQPLWYKDNCSKWRNH